MKDKCNDLSVRLRCIYGRNYTGQIGNLEMRFGQYWAGECDGYTARAAQ
ncbi:MAG: hypothetical protein ABL869_08720 [Candidatus Nitrotoga sp.]